MTDEQDITIDAGDENLDDSVLAEEHQGDAIKKLKERLKEAQEKAKENLDGWQRAQAEFVNIRKRDEEAKGEFLKFATANIIAELLPTLDALSSAVSHGTEGVEQIQNLFLKTLKQYGLEEIDPVGEIFDPNQHEAIGLVKTDKQEDDHKVLEVLQKGYIIQGKVIRPAKVKIGQYD